MDLKPSKYLVWPTFASGRVTHLLHIELIKLLFNGCAKLPDIGGNWNMLSYTLIQSIPNVLNGWHVWWLCRTSKNWDIFSFQELCTDPWGHALSCRNTRWCMNWMQSITVPSVLSPKPHTLPTIATCTLSLAALSCCLQMGYLPT